MMKSGESVLFTFVASRKQENDIADGIHLMAVKSEHLIPEILKNAGLNLEY